MDGREIPGFYFDKEKGKYFRITTEARSAPGYKYTHTNVKKQREHKRNEAEETRQFKRRKKQTVVLSQPRSALSRVYLERELGIARRGYYLQSVWPGAGIAEYDSHSVIPPSNIRYFDRGPDLSVLYAVSGETQILCHDLKEAFPGIRFPADTIARMTSPVSSLNFLPASRALVITTSGSDRPPVVYLTDPETDGPYVGEQFTPRHCTSIWGASPRPDFSVSETGRSVPATATEAVAVAASSNLQLYTRAQSGRWECEVLRKSTSDILALTWLSDTAIAMGQRDGKILIYDTRAHGSAHILSHSAPISHLRRADDFTRIVCAGLFNTLCTYDMRASKPPVRPEHIPVTKWRGRNGHPFVGSQCITKFREYRNKDVLELGMDVHSRLGLVAAANEYGSLKVWNMYTGALIKKRLNADYEEPRLGETNAAARMRCVRFLEDADGDVSLWANVDAGVTRFEW
ncbi:uncharacterized protein EI97DRAFT_464431 [Westerdykella ornata]|uniref:WD40 repeat-like protein n=1 Tax=Westerdykella ornata TaxID=318751 RepID=A0A6A6JV75_WESOR|nr:uncharacterized protein EI97DRAFT_464431 [Westerdykella ornata]KAF2280492.1 hypothetical protein EI97DRAFT_464431 [Westerdykella ornata]